MDIETVPEDILLHIFYWATYGPVRNLEDVIDPGPFESLGRQKAENETRAALAGKRTLALVCRKWRILSANFLFEEIWIGPYGLQALMETLESENVQEEIKGRYISHLGARVKRIFICLTHDDLATEHVWSCVCRILLCCPNVQILSRLWAKNRQVMYQLSECGISTTLRRSRLCGAVPAAQELAVPSRQSDRCDLFKIIMLTKFAKIRRLDWGLCRGCKKTRGPFTEVDPHCSALSSLEVVSVGVHDKVSPLMEFFPPIELPRLYLPNVHTLRLYSSRVSMQEFTQHAIHLPQLRRIVQTKPSVGRVDSSRMLRWDNSQILEYEIEEVDYADFRASADLGMIPRICKNIDTLHIPVFKVAHQYLELLGKNAGCKTMKTIGLHAAPKLSDAIPSQIQWHLFMALQSLLGNVSTFLQLEKIVLFGAEWLTFVSDKQLANLLTATRRVKIECTDFRVCDVLSLTGASVDPVVTVV